MSDLINLIRRAYGLLVAFANLLQSPFLLALRVYFFWQLFQTGEGKLSNIGRVIGFFRSLGIPAPHINAYFVSSLECFGGLLLIVGLASRPIALMVTVSMSVAYITADLEAVTGILSDPDKFAKADPFPFLMAALIVLIFGPGMISIDAFLKRFIGEKKDSSFDRSAGAVSQE